MGVSPLGFTSQTKTKGLFSGQDFLNGNLFFSFHCEMSLRSVAVVFSSIKKDELCAVYRLKYTRDKNPESWYYPELKIVNLYKPKTIFSKGFKCHE